MRPFAGFLKTRQLLLVLDNFEHLIEAAPLLAQLLASCPRLQILVTSRVLLRLSGEQTFVVPPLRLTDPARLADFAALVPCEAVTLFTERAQRVNPNFALDAENVRAAIEICSWLDGLPLAIELAAVRVRILTPRMLLARLQNRLQLLTGGPRNASSRQQTLRGAIAWSYDLLDEPQKRLFRRLAVFAGGCTLEAAEAIGMHADPAALDIFEGLALLCDNSLLQQRVQEDGEPRFVMLETLREFALERLAESGEEETVRLLHARYFLAVAEVAEPELRSHGQAVALRRFEEEHDNLRAALRWSNGRGEMQLRLAGALWWFWYMRGRLAEGSRWLDAALTAAANAPGAARAKVLHGAAALAWRRGGYEVATRLSGESLALAPNIGGLGGIAFALHMGALLARDQGNLSAAKELEAQSLAGFEEHGDRWGAALAVAHLAILAQIAADDEQAAACYEQASTWFREVGDKGMLAYTLQAFGMLAEVRGAPALAVTRQHEGLLLQQELRDMSGIGLSMLGLAGATAAAGAIERATRLLGASDALLEAVGGLGPTFYREYFDRHQAALRAALGEPAFALACSAGHAMSAEQAVAYALAEYPADDERAAAEVPAETNTPHDPAHLTAREFEVLRLIATGCSNQQIADALVLSIHTVERHISTIYQKIGTRGKANATAYAIAHDLVTPR